MAVMWNPAADVQRTAHGYSVAPENVVIDDQLSGRYETTDVSDLAADIKENGQLEPAVCWKNEHGFPVLAAGHRRWRAITEINKGKRPENRFRLQFTWMEAKSPEEAFDYTIRENRNRVNPSALDDAYNMHVYQTRFGLGDLAIAKKFFPGIKGEDIKKAVQKVQDTLKLLELSDELKEQLKEGKMSTSAAQVLASIPSRLTQEKVAKLAAEKSKKTGKDGSKTIQVNAVKEAKAEITGSGKGTGTPRTPISENTPAKLLEKYKAAMTVASSLAYECMAFNKKFHGLTGDKEVMLELAEQIGVMCHLLKIPQQAEIDKWAADNTDLATVLTGEAPATTVAA